VCLGWCLAVPFTVWGQDMDRGNNTLLPLQADDPSATLESGQQDLPGPLNLPHQPGSPQFLQDDGALPLHDFLMAKGEGSAQAGKEKTKVPRKVEFTGHLRLRYESKQNFDLVYDRSSLNPPASDNDDNFFLSQLRFFLDLRPNEFVYVHFTFQDSREFGSHQIDHDALDEFNRNTFQNKLDIYEGYLKLKLGEAPAWFQVGRQELVYGNKRLLGNNGWGNSGRSWDAAKFIYEEGDFKLDLFAGNRVLVDSNAWDHVDHHDNLLGAYATVKNLPQGLQDVYLLYRDNNPNNIEIYTLGTRIMGDADCLDWNLEGAYQWGTSSDTVQPFLQDTQLDHEAWAVHAELGYTCKSHHLKPRYALEYNFATGDEDPYDGENNNFDQLYPTNHVPFGIMDFIGWKNMHSLAPKLSWAHSKKLKINWEWHFFWLDEQSNDAWYDSAGRSFRNAQGADVSKFLGHEFNLYATYKVNEKLEMETGYGHFFAAQYAADTAPVRGGADDADFVYLMTTYKF